MCENIKKELIELKSSDKLSGYKLDFNNIKPFEVKWNYQDVILNGINLRLFNTNPNVYIPCKFEKFVKDLSTKIFNGASFLHNLNAMDIGSKKEDEVPQLFESCDLMITYKKLKKLEKFVSCETLQILTCLILGIQ